MTTHLTRTEQAIYDVLFAADRQMTGREVHALATGAEFAFGNPLGTHVRNMRVKGVPIRSGRFGYYLEGIYTPPARAERPKRDAIVHVPAEPMLSILDGCYLAMSVARAMKPMEVAA